MPSSVAGSVVVDTTHSPHARLKPVPVSAVQLTDAFWATRLRINREVTLPAQYQHLEETGRLDNFRVAAGKKAGSFVGIYFNDSDLYKWLEAASWALATEDDPDLRALVEMAVTEIAGAQQPDGYLNTYYMFERAGERWSNLRDMHELYCAGHLIQAAVAHYRATGGERLLDVARRLADCIDGVFGPQPGKREGAAGHEEIEMALVELARATGEARYADLAQFLVDMRGRGHAGGDDYHQDDRPFRKMDRMVGHAVRAVYLNAGAADLYAERGEGAVRTALDRMWANMTTRRLYASGGIGSRYRGEAFGEDYELPNRRAYAETCAAIGSVMWNWRMLALEGEARYADLIEQTLYNGVLVGLSLDGERYFYQNPLANDGTHRREPWFGCACCPPNIARTLSSLPGYVYSVSDAGLWVHLYVESEARIALPGGRAVTVRQATDYPWNGKVAIAIEGEGTFSLFVRVPGWCAASGARVALSVNGERIAAEAVPGSYAEVRRAWQAGDVLTLELPMPVRRITCHPRVANNAGRVALARGPLLYCLEGADHPGIDLRDLAITTDAVLRVEPRPDLLGGVAVLRGEGLVTPPGPAWEDRLYGPAPKGAARSAGHSAPLVAVPYYAWANREPGQMAVWIRSR